MEMRREDLFGKLLQVHAESFPDLRHGRHALNPATRFGRWIRLRFGTQPVDQLDGINGFVEAHECYFPAVSLRLTSV